MPTTRVYKNVKIYSGGHDLSGASNQLELGYEFDKLEVKHFGQACHYSVKGLPRLAFSLQGNAYSNDTPAGIEDVLHGRLGEANEPMTWCPVDGAEGDVAYFAKTLETTYQAGAAVGELYAYTASGEGENTPLVRGHVLGTGAKTAGGSGTARELGAVASGQRLYACLHVLEVAGTNTTLNVVVKSDEAQGFASPITRATFAQATQPGAQYLVPIDGPITDTWWRATWNLGGTSPSFTIALAVGIQ